jgi:hypothetical protein
MSRRTVLLAAVLMLAACGGASGDDAGTTVAPDAPADTTPATEAPTATEAPATTAAPASTAPPAPSGDAGGGDPMMVPAGDSQVSVDGSALTPQSLLRCIPFSESGEDLDLQADRPRLRAVRVRQSGRFRVFTRFVDSGERRRRWGIDGVFSGMVSEYPDGNWYVEFDQPPLDGPPLEWSGDRVSGTMTLDDSYEQADPIEVSFDVPVPPDVHDCSL